MIVIIVDDDIRSSNIAILKSQKQILTRSLGNNVMRCPINSKLGHLQIKVATYIDVNGLSACSRPPRYFMTGNCRIGVVHNDGINFAHFLFFI